MARMFGVGTIKVWRMRCENHVICMAEMRIIYEILVGKPEGKKEITWKT
jgi:hypothetical protein